MADWPSTIPRPTKITGQYVRPQVRSPKEANYAQSRPAVSRSVFVWSLAWDDMSSTEFAALKDFFDSYQGNTFTWAHPDTLTEYTVRFTEDFIGFSYNVPNYYEEIAVGLEQI
jgi:hypothetical protein